MNKIEKLFQDMWDDYIKLNPQAQQIVKLLENEGQPIVNDHIALRTFDLPQLNLDVVSKPFLDCGYEEKGDYHFSEKKLYAKHYEHTDSSLPKVFISQLLVGEFSETVKDIIRSKVESIDASTFKDFNLMVSGRPWELSSSEYEYLKLESEYAAWVAAIGFRPNHFTISINHLDKYTEVESLNTFLKGKGIVLNAQGGEIKGSKDVCLEQSSTLANNVEVEFSDKKIVIPSCYFEFAKRYPLDNGNLYQGFVAKSADKIFESTDKGQ